jgi:hypothetical protein
MNPLGPVKISPVHKILLTGPWAECTFLQGPCEHIYIFMYSYLFALKTNHVYGTYSIWRGKDFLHIKTCKHWLTHTSTTYLTRASDLMGVLILLLGMAEICRSRVETRSQ